MTVFVWSKFFINKDEKIEYVEVVWYFVSSGSSRGGSSGAFRDSDIKCG